MSEKSPRDEQRNDIKPFDFRGLPHAVSEPATLSPDFLVAALNRLEETIDQETSALRALDASAIGEFNSRKSQSLLELDRAERLLRGRPLPPHVSDRLRTLQTKLESNRWLLLLHLEAVREVAAVIAGAMCEAESDGTYGHPLRPTKPKRHP